jgi:hypothetical protein
VAPLQQARSGEQSAVSRRRSSEARMDAAARCDSPKGGNGAWAVTSPRKRRAAPMARGDSRIHPLGTPRCPMPNPIHSGFLDSLPGPLNPPNYRRRTRMPGGVTGNAGSSLPMSISWGRDGVRRAGVSTLRITNLRAPNPAQPEPNREVGRFQTKLWHSLLPEARWTAPLLQVGGETIRILCHMDRLGVVTN